MYWVLQYDVQDIGYCAVVMLDTSTRWAAGENHEKGYHAISKGYHVMPKGYDVKISHANRQHANKQCTPIDSACPETVVLAQILVTTSILEDKQKHYTENNMY